MSSLDAHTDLARVAEGLRTEFRRKLHALRTQLAAEIRQVEKASAQRNKELAGRLQATAERLAGIAGAQDELRRQTDGELRGARQAIARLTGEIQLIEGRLRLEHGVAPIDLDAVAAPLQPLVAQAREAEDLRCALLDDETRAAYDERLTAYAEMERAVRETRTRALTASRTLATAKAGGRAFGKAAAAYRREREHLRTQTEELRAAAAGREAAQAALAEDARRQQSYQEHRGATAVNELAAHVRDRIDAAVEAHALFPAWFTITELGHRPPAARAAQWRDAATLVVLYRITHRIGHPVLALGLPPEGGHLAERHATVLAALRGLTD